MLSGEADEAFDSELLAQIQSAPEADFRSFEQLVNLYRGRIVANCRHITGDSGVADDLAQEVFVKAYFGLRKFERRSSFGHWLRVIKVRHCLTYLKRKRGRVLVDIAEKTVQGRPELSVPPAVERKIDELSHHLVVNDILSAMPDTLRLPLVLRDMDDLSYDDIAESLGLSLPAVKMRIKRAREHFRDQYKKVTASGQPTRRANV